MKLDNKRLRAWLIENEAAKQQAAKAAAKRELEATAKRELAAAQRELAAEKKHMLKINIGQSVYLKGDFRSSRRREHISLTKGIWYGKPYDTVANGKADCAFVTFRHVAKIVNEGDFYNFSIMKLTRLA